MKDTLEIQSSNRRNNNILKETIENSKKTIGETRNTRRVTWKSNILTEGTTRKNWRNICESNRQ